MQVRRSRSGDEPMHAFAIDLDHLVGLFDGRRDRRDSLLVDDSDLGLA